MIKLNKIIAQKEDPIIKWVIGLTIVGVLLIVGTVLIFWYNGHISIADIDTSYFGIFGDFIGGFVGTLFGVATTILVLLTFYSQKTELRENAALLKKQRFEDTFFSLVQVQQDLKKNINFDTVNRLTIYGSEHTETTGIIIGDIFFQFAAEDFYRFYLSSPELVEPKIVVLATDISYSLNPLEDIPKEEAEKRIKSRYKRFFDRYHEQLGHYFRHLFYVLTYIEQNENDEISLTPEKEEMIKKKYSFYSGIIQAQMTSSELYLLFYNGICFKKMKALIEKYKLVENVVMRELADPERHQNLYKNNNIKSWWSMQDW